MEKLLQFFQNLGQRFQELTPTNKAVALGLLALILGSVMAMSLWLQEPDYQLLYANLSEEDASAIYEQLQTQNVKPQLSNNGRTIHVPSNQVHELRLKLAGQGLPKGHEVGLELFEDMPLGMTEFIQKLNFQRALQGELARTITSLDVVDMARVHLVIPKEDVFIKEQQKGKASVTLKLRAGRSLSESQVQGIIHLVSSSVEGVDPKNVALLDFKGNILSGAQGMEDGAILTATNYKHQRRVEQQLEKSLIRMLEDALGTDKVIARVTAELNFDKVEKTEEIFDPDSQVVRSEQASTESVTGAVPPGGAPGVQSLLPGADSQAGEGLGEPAKRNQEKTTFNYEINKVVKHTLQPTGSVRKLSVAVLVDGVMEGEPPAYRARTPEEMAKLEQIVKSAVGYDEKRGDTIQLQNVEFDRSQEKQRAEQLAQEELIDKGLMAGKYLFIAIIVLFFLFRVIRPLVNWVTTSVEVVEDDAHLPSPEELEAAEEEKRLARMNQQNLEVRKAVADFVDNDPKFAAGVLRKWMRERT
ncbi:MAG: flagellar M-ring protein FliF [Nitrospina sp.]|nr:flagellar M-ring protein FliF [Nitrospina sp.]